MKLLSISSIWLALSAALPAHAGGVGCEQLKPRYPSSVQAHAALVGQTRIGERWTAEHDAWVAALCADDRAAVDRIIGQHSVSDDDRRRIVAVLAQGEREEVAPSRNPAVDQAIDRAFDVWSQTEWVADKYVTDTSRTTQERTTAEGLLVNGTFMFRRFQGPPQRLPFTALLKATDKGYAVDELCYAEAARNDAACRSTGTTFARELMGRLARGDLQ